MESYGTLRLLDRRWVISCEPHVRAKIKRVFPRAPQHAAESIFISNTPENCRDLLWFLDRYPMEVTDRDRLLAGANDHIEAEQRLAELLKRTDPLPPLKLAEPAREYQLFAAAMLDVKGGLLLADDVGVGKTVSGICGMMREERLPAVVVCPAHMPRQWEQAINRFAPQLKVHRIRDGQPYSLVRKPRGRQIDLLPDRPPDVLILSYHKLRAWAESLVGVAKYFIFDECQQLRRPDSAIYRACQLVARAAVARIGLSATPIYNYGSEFYWVVDVLLPGALGQRDEFVREWCKSEGGDKARISDSKEFGAYLRREGIMLRRTRADVGRELPLLQKIVQEIDADAEALKKLDGNAVSLARLVLSHNEQFRGQKMQAAGEFDSLMRQATGIAKAPFVAEFVRLLCENGEKVLLFGWHREVYSIWLEKLKDLKPVMYTGSESESQKARSVDAFVNGDSQVMIMSLRSGAGVDGLQSVCRITVHGELDWSPGVHEQNVGRLDRDGQAVGVIAYFLVADDGSDPIMAEVCGVKREQIEGVRNPNSALAERIESGEHHLRRLARDFLEKRGVAIPQIDSVVKDITT